MSEILRYRGDTKVIVFQLWSDKEAGVKLDITDYTFKLTVDPKKAPTDDVNNLFSLDGTIVGVATDGKVMFEPTAINTNQPPGTYYFDFEVIDASGKIGTEMLDKFKITQDITK